MNCPLCRSSKKRRIYKLCDNMKIMGSAFPNSSSYIAQCKNCGLVYMDTEAVQQDFIHYYVYDAIAPKYYDMFGEARSEEYYEHIFKLINPYVKKTGRILDIAGSWGEMDSYIKQKGCDNITDLDPNPKCLEYAEKTGVKTICADSINMNNSVKDKYDLIILNHALEHILDIGNTMKNIYEALANGGFLFIELPDAEGYADEDAAPFNFLTYEHVIHMSMHDLENLSAEFGFEIIESGKYYKKVSNYPSIYAVMKKSGKRSISFSDVTGKNIEKYIKKSNTAVGEFIGPLKESGEPLILWGIGASTAMLLGAFKDCNLKKLIDRNPARQGISFVINDRKMQIEPPDNVGDGTIVILSIPYYDSIKKQIREMGLKNKIVSLR